VNLELGLLGRNVDFFRPLLDKLRSSEPEPLELPALASYLHSFYTGVENVFKQIAQDIDGSFPSGLNSHIILLGQMAQTTDHRPAVISEELRRQLRDYMDFRHVFRHAYTFELKWRKMSDLVLHCEETLERLQTELDAFFATG
jgi:hypothetical protein